MITFTLLNGLEVIEVHLVLENWQELKANKRLAQDQVLNTYKLRVVSPKS